jgi:hypothetical protein
MDSDILMTPFFTASVQFRVLPQVSRDAFSLPSQMSVPLNENSVQFGSAALQQTIEVITALPVTIGKFANNERFNGLPGKDR